MNELTIACRGGNLEWAKIIRSNNLSLQKPFDIHYNKEQPFRESCANGHLHIVEWLYSLEYIKLKNIKLELRGSRNLQFEMVIMHWRPDTRPPPRFALLRLHLVV